MLGVGVPSWSSTGGHRWGCHLHATWSMPFPSGRATCTAPIPPQTGNARVGSAPFQGQRCSTSSSPSGHGQLLGRIPLSKDRLAQVFQPRPWTLPTGPRQQKGRMTSCMASPCMERSGVWTGRPPRTSISLVRKGGGWTRMRIPLCSLEATSLLVPVQSRAIEFGSELNDDYVFAACAGWKWTEGGVDESPLR